MSRVWREWAVVLISGGLDSCVTAAVANLDYRMAFLHVSYGQRATGQELRAFYRVADHYRVEQRLVASASYLQEIGGSSLTDPNINVAPANLDNPDIPTSYVPFRNAHLLSIGVSWGEVLGAVKLFIGAVEEDSSGYPDCREEFYQAFNRAIEVGTRPETRLEVATPLIRLNKAEIVKKGVELQAPLELTWSCYRSDEPACGACDSCALRLRGFEQAGIQDPISYALS